MTGSGPRGGERTATSRSGPADETPSAVAPDFPRSCLALERGGEARWRLETPRGPIELGGRVRIVGILNVTPDSFYDGGAHATAEAALAHAERLVEEGADWLDVGGESTRPGSDPVPAEEEARRVLPVIERLVRSVSIPISVDTRKASVARAALDAGASIVNDVSGCLADPRMPPLLAERRVPLVLNHMRGTPKTMQEDPRYGDPVAEILSDLRARIAALEEAGVESSRIVVDPGLGFGKRPSDNLEILRRLAEFHAIGRPILVGPSRKSFLGLLLGGRPAEGRLFGTAAAVAAAVARGAAAVRVHDVGPMRDVVRVMQSILDPRGDG